MKLNHDAHGRGMRRIVSSILGTFALAGASVVACSSGQGPQGSGAQGSAENGGASPNSDASCDSGSHVATSVLYVESNIPEDGKNSILAYRRNTDGSLTPLAGSPFLTGGAGIANPGQILGPDDSDQELIASPDHTRLFAVNSGSDTIAVFDIAADGSLTPVDGSPFPSGGSTPVSLGLRNDELYVVNSAQSHNAQCSPPQPSYSTLEVRHDGSLRVIPRATIPAGPSPSQVLVSIDKQHVFGDDFMSPTPLRSFLVGHDGMLREASGSPVAIPDAASGNAAALGLAENPVSSVLYAGFVQRGQVGAYSFDASGQLTFLTATPSGKAVCWLRVNSAGTRLYAVNSGEGSIGTFDTTDPRTPVSLQKLTLRDLGPSFTDATGTVQPSSSSPFQEAIDPTNAWLYVVAQRVTIDPTFTGGNAIHILSIAADGTLSEQQTDVALPVPATARAQGLVVF